MWELVFMVLVLKIPVLYVCWVVWWAVKAEPVVGPDGDQVHQPINWKPWRRPDGPRPRRGGPHGGRTRLRAAGRRERASA